MNYLPFASLRTRLMLLVLLALLPVFGLAFYDRYDQRQRNARAIQDQALQLAQSAVTEQRDLIGGAHQLLLPLAQLSVVRGEGPIPCDTFFAELLKENTTFTNLGVIDPRGEIICAGVPLTAPVNLSAHPYFTRVLQQQVVFGESEIGVIADTPTINIGFPFVDDAGQVRGAVFASIDLTWFHEFADAEKMPPGSTLVLAEHTGALVIRYPDMTPLDARAAANHVAQWFNPPSTQRVAEFTDPDEVARLYAFIPFDNGEYAGVGIPSAIAYAEVDQLARRDSIILLLVTALALGGAWIFGDWFIARRVRTLLRATQRVAAGDLSARTGQSYGVSELGELARAFDKMAATLQQRAEEQQQSEAALRRQAAELAAITRLSRQVTSVPDLNQVLASIARVTAELAQSDASGVYIPDAAGVLRLAASYGISTTFSDALNAIGVRPSEGAIGRAVVERQPAQVPDMNVGYDHPFTPVVQAEGLRAVLAVPMIRDAHAIGGIALWHRQPHHFSSSEIAFAQAIAQQCVNALENARLLAETEKRASHFAALHETAQAIGAQQDLPALLEMIVERATMLLSVSYGALYLYDATHHDLELVVQKGLPTVHGTRLRLGEGMAGRVAQTHQPLVISDYSHWEHHSPQFADIPLSAVLEVPLLYRGELIGVLNVAEVGATTRQFNDEDTRLLGLFANQVAGAVHNARLLQEAQTRAEQMALLYDAGLALNSILEPHAQLAYLFKIAMRALKADRAEFSRYDAERNIVQLEMCVGYSAEDSAALHQMSTPLGDEQSLVGWVATHRLPLNLPQVTADPRFVVIDPQLRSGLWMPVERENQLLGVFGVLSTQPAHFHAEDERSLALFANQAAIALENARLFSELQSSLRMLTRLYELSSELFSVTTLQETAQIATQILRASFAATAAWIHLFDPNGALTFSYGTGMDSSDLDLTPRPDGLSVQVWRSGQPQIVNDPGRLHPAARAYDAQTAVVLPLRDTPVNLGALFLDYDTPRLVSEHQVEVLSLFANQVALAIKRVRLAAETRHRAEQLTVLNRIASAINQPARLDDLLAVIHREVTATLPCDAFFIALYDPMTNELDYRIQIDQDLRLPPQRRPLKAGLSWYVVTQRKPLLVRDRDRDSPIPPSSATLWGTMQRAESWLGVPIQIGDIVVGIVNVQSYTPNRYDEEDAQLLGTIADQIAVAIQRARLFEETQQRLTELEAVNEISQVLRATDTSVEMLPALLDAILALLNASSGAAILARATSHAPGDVVARGWLANLFQDSALRGQDIGSHLEIVSHVLATGELYRVIEFQSDPLTPAEMRAQIPSGWGGICSPIRVTHQAIGALIVSVPAPRVIQPNEVQLLTTIAEMAGNAIHRATLHEQTEERLRRLNALHTIDTAISASLDLRVTLDILLNQVGLQLGADAADVLLLNPPTQMLEYVAGHGFRTSGLAPKPLRLGEGAPARAVFERKIIHLPNLATVADPRAEWFADEGFVTSFAAPLISKGQCKGVLEVFQRAPLSATAEWLDYFGTLAGQAALAIENTTLFTSLQRSNVELALAYDVAIEGWSHALDLRDHETEGHAQRVAEMTVRLARRLGISAADRVNIRRGALLHDIGKMAVPDHILFKQGTLSQSENETMRQHPQYAYELLSPIEYLRGALDIPYCHHEKWDGTGYPRGLMGEEIPLAARVFAVVDVWDALRSERPYRHAWHDDQVKAHIKSLSGTHLDPQITSIFLELLEEESER